MMSEQRPTPDFDRMAAEYDRLEPLFQPISTALLERLGELADGGLVLDVACGTGEPGLTLARRAPGLQVFGIDTAPSMVEVARHKATTEPVPNARYEVMEAEKIDLATSSAAAVISRLGLLLVGEPVAGATEMARVLKPGGRFSLAVWDRMRHNTFLDLSIRTLNEVLPSDRLPDFGWMDDLAAPGRREGWLRDAGMRSVHNELYSWTHDEPNFAAIQELMAVGPFGPFFSALNRNEQAKAHTFLEGLVSEHREPDGSYKLPMACRLLWGQA